MSFLTILEDFAHDLAAQDLRVREITVDRKTFNLISLEVLQMCSYSHDYNKGVTEQLNKYSEVTIHTISGPITIKKEVK